MAVVILYISFNNYYISSRHNSNDAWGMTLAIWPFVQRAIKKD